MTTQTLTTIAADGTRLLSHVCLPNTAPARGIIVAPEWWGVEDTHPTTVAKDLAKAGFAAVVLDVYGEGKLTTDAAQANEWMSAVLNNPSELMDRCRRIYEDFIALNEVDGARIGAVGYCFGGKLALDMARKGIPLKAVATFHGNPTPIQPADASFGAKVLVAHGGADSMIPMSAIDGLKTELDHANVDYQIDVYDDAKHGFTNRLADKRAANNGIDLGYNEHAAKASWNKMLSFMNEYV